MSTTDTKKRKSGKAETVPARIRIPNAMVERILRTPPERPTMDGLQARLMGLVSGSDSQADRILVTSSQEDLDLLRDWCTRLIADYRLESDDDSKKVVGSATRVIRFMDNHETRAQRAARHGRAPVRRARSRHSASQMDREAV